jgi:hypothetical protein
MRHFQQPGHNSEADLITALIQCLSPERRRELLDAAAQSRMLELIDNHQARTVEEFLHAVHSDPHWSVLKDLLVSDVIRSESDGAVETKTEAAAGTRNQRLEDAPLIQLPIVSKAATPKTANEASPAKPPASPKPRTVALAKATSPTRKSTGDILEDIVMAVTLEPGLRSEEVRKRLGKPAVLVKASLRALRKSKRLRTEGERRNTRYFVPATKSG